MIAGPEIALILSEYSSKIDNGVNHHMQTQSSQDCFVKDVKNLVNAFEDAGNPYMEESDELLTLDTKVIMSSEVVSNIRRAESLGISQLEKFYSARIVSSDKSFYDPIVKNKLNLFKSGSQKQVSNSKRKLSSAISDVQLFSRLYISCQSRDGDLKHVFAHENHP